jgi:hypothetical protein
MVKLIKLRWLIIVMVSLTGTLSVQGQTPFYTPDLVQEVRVYFNDPGWRLTLDSLMKAGDDSTRILGDVMINGILRKDAGIRFKGFSSWNYGAVKNPFNIEIDYLIRNRNIQGIKKIKLGNVIHDPSFVREALSYDIARQYMPAPESGFANLYINDTLIGLYSNVESVDDLFAGKHFGSPKAFMVKGSPEKLIFPFGQNANLALLSTIDSSAYFPYYQMVSDYGWNALMRFTEVLNTQPENLSTVLNIDRTLWMHAFNYALVNLDSYIGYAQNYYLVMDEHGRFNPVVWDLNMSFGSFRSSDASTHFQGLTIDHAKKLDPLQHLTFSVSPRPLLTVLLSDPTLKRKYLAHLRTIMNEQIGSGDYLLRAQMWQALIAQDVYADTNKFYSDANFLNNLSVTVGGSGSMLSYPGMKDLMDGRLAYLASYPGYTGEPLIDPAGVMPERPAPDEIVTVTARITGGNDVRLYVRQGISELFQEYLMFDDGLHDDGAPDDGVFGAAFPATGDIIQYYFYAQNDSAGAFNPERAESVYYSIYPLIRRGVLVVNEIAFDQNVVPANQPGCREPWIEIYNNSRDSLVLKDLFLETDPAGMLWSFPDSLLPPGGFVLVVPDGQTTIPWHTTTLPDGDAGHIKLFYPDHHVVDSVTYKNISRSMTLGRYPNGAGSFSLLPPTPGHRNKMGVVSKNQLLIAPNPASDYFYFLLTPDDTDITWRLCSPDGSVLVENSVNDAIPGQTAAFRVSVAGVAQGICFLQVFTKYSYLAAPVIIKH